MIGIDQKNYLKMAWYLLLCQKNELSLHCDNEQIDTTMARPIRETPILTGEDAIRFEEMRLQVENMSEEQRAKNRKEFEKRVAEAKKLIQFCL